MKFLMPCQGKLGGGAVIVIAVTSLFYFLFRLGVGEVMYADDFSYGRCFEQWMTADDFYRCRGAHLGGVADALRSVVWHWLHYNGRLSAAVLFFLALLPWQVVAVIHAVMWWLSTAAVLKFLNCGGRVSALEAAGFVWACFLLLPFNDHIVSRSFAAGYLWTQAVVMQALLLFFSRREFLSWRLVGGALFMFVAATMHEGFSVPVAVMLSAVAVFNRSELKRQHFVFYIAWLAGTAAVALAPSIVARSGAISGGQSFFDPLFFVKAVFDFNVVFILAAVAVLTTLVCGLRRFGAVMRRNAVWLTAIVAVWLMCALTARYSRAAWFGLLAASIVTFDLLCELAVGVKIGRRLHRGLTVAVCSGLFFWQGALAYRQSCLSAADREIADMVSRGGGNLFYYDSAVPGDVEWWLMDINQYYNDYAIDSEYLYASTPGADKSAVSYVMLPRAYRGVEFGELPAVGGTASMRGVWPFYYSDKRIDVERVRVEFTAEGCDNVNVCYALLRWLKYGRCGHPAMTGRDDRVLLELPVIKALGDTAWFYQIDFCRRECRGLRVSRIDLL